MPRPFQIVTKPAGPACNLACTYCFYLDKPDTGRMAPGVLESFTRHRIEAQPGRLGEPADIARAVAFLAGPSATYITGETLHVNGGMYMP